jgi:hypothetical protein
VDKRYSPGTDYLSSHKVTWYLVNVTSVPSSQNWLPVVWTAGRVDNLVSLSRLLLYAREKADAGAAREQSAVRFCIVHWAPCAIQVQSWLYLDFACLLLAKLSACEGIHELIPRTSLCLPTVTARRVAAAQRLVLI